MQIDSFTQQYPAQAASLYLNPFGLLLSPGQVSGIYGQCHKKHPNGNPVSGGGGVGGPGGGGTYIYIVTGGSCEFAGADGAPGCDTSGYWYGPINPQRK